MPARLESGALPCPFCRYGKVLLIGGTDACLYYRCAGCAETWTARLAPPIHPSTGQQATIH